MKTYLIIPTCLLLISSYGLAQDESATGSSSVAEELSEEARILRELVEEYKKKKDGTAAQTTKIEQPPVPAPQASSMPSLDPTAAAESLSNEVKAAVNPAEEKMTSAVESVGSHIPPAPQPPAVTEEKPKEAIASVGSLISDEIEPVGSMISEAAANTEAAKEEVKQVISSPDSIVLSDEPTKTGIRMVDRSAIPPIEEPAPEMPKIETPIINKTEIPPLEIPAANPADMPNVEVPSVAKSEIPSLEEPKPTIADVPKETAPEAPKMESPPTPSFNSSSIVLNDAPSPKPKMEVPVVTTTAPESEDGGNQSAADVVAKVETAEKLEGSEMKPAESPAPEAVETEERDEAVAEADPMKKAPQPTISKKQTIKKTPPKPEDTPLVIATKRPETKKEESPTDAPPAEDPTMAEAGETEPSQPEATARSVTPLKDLGRMIFGPKESGSRGGIFKRKNRTAAE